MKISSIRLRGLVAAAVVSSAVFAPLPATVHSRSVASVTTTPVKTT
ncbi:MAG: hypothetical protein QOG52_447, partial [Frankiaceae bacterium]|nr:hypothetical protein [Frankiaceae bacterium]